MHFNSMGGVDRLTKKMTSIVEGYAEVVKSNYTVLDRQHIKQVLTDGRNPYNGELRTDPYDINNISLPYLKEFVKKYPYFLWEYDERS